MIILSECTQVTFLKHVLFGRFHVDSLGIVNRCGMIADPNDFDAAFVGER